MSKAAQRSRNKDRVETPGFGSKEAINELVENRFGGVCVAEPDCRRSRQWD